MDDKYKEILSRYIPREALNYCFDLIKENKVSLVITRERKSIYGNYRPSRNTTGVRHKITVNHSLNPYAFLITLIHEMAHLVSYLKYGNRIEPHGTEWKTEYKRLMFPLLNEAVFPKELLFVLKKHFINPKSSSGYDADVVKALSAYDKNDDGTIFLEELKVGDYFILQNELFLIKGIRTIRKTRYICLKLSNGKDYIVSPTAKVRKAEKF